MQNTEDNLAKTIDDCNHYFAQSDTMIALLQELVLAHSYSTSTLSLHSSLILILSHLIALKQLT